MFVAWEKSGWNTVSKAMKYTTAIRYGWGLGWRKHPWGIWSYFFQKVGHCWEMRWVELGLNWVVCGDWRCWDKDETWMKQVLQLEWVIVGGKSDVFILKLVCSSWGIQCLALLKFLRCMFPGGAPGMRVWNVVAWVMLPLLSFWSHLYGLY